MSPALNGSSAIQHFEGNDVIEIHHGITFDFYIGLPHMQILSIVYRTTNSWCPPTPKTSQELFDYTPGLYTKSSKYSLTMRV